MPKTDVVNGRDGYAVGSGNCQKPVTTWQCARAKYEAKNYLDGDEKNLAARKKLPSCWKRAKRSTSFIFILSIIHDRLGREKSRFVDYRVLGKLENKLKMPVIQKNESSQ